jgi:hypothetical protein
MHAVGPDVETILGPPDPPADARAYLRGAVARAGAYFAEVIPLALHVMTHPSFDPATLGRVTPGGPADLRTGLEARLKLLIERGKIAVADPDVVAKLLLSLAHDWALGKALRHATPGKDSRDLTALVDVVWAGLKPKK